jgi:hypothetical protein
MERFEILFVAVADSRVVASRHESQGGLAVPYAVYGVDAGLEGDGNLFRRPDNRKDLSASLCPPFKILVYITF